MQEHTSPPAHSCAHCVDIVFPGTPETIHVTWISPPETLFIGKRFFRQDWNNLGLSLADLRVGSDAGCDFSQHLKDCVEPCLYEDTIADAVQLYTHQSDDGTILIEPLISLQKFQHPDDVFGGQDPSRCFMYASRWRARANIPCVLTKPSGGDLDSQFQFQRPISLNPLSACTVTDVCARLRRCEEERDGRHKICSLSERAYIPTRLLKISGHPSRLQLRLVCGEDMEERDISGYVALSYCWGGDQLSKLTKGNYNLYKMEIPWKTLPKGIQDAVRTADALGLHYLWIDSMCIVQDSKEDKDAEIIQMARVYAHATLTVINKRGDKVTDGFLHPRTLPSGTSSIQIRTDDSQTHRVTLIFAEASRLEDNVAMNTRGWALQEYLLSRRRLTIGTWSTELRCRREVAAHRDGGIISIHPGRTEGIPPMSNGGDWAVDRSFESDEAESVYSSNFIDAVMFFSVNPEYPCRQLVELFVCRRSYRIVEAYSSRFVTEWEDRILAISGIAERFARFIPKRYITGLWESMMPDSLCWLNCGVVTDRPVEYRGPSWSWVSIDGGVAHKFSSHYVCEVLSIEYALKSVDVSYGVVSSTTLHIKSRAFCVEWKYTRSEISPKKDVSEFRWRRDGHYHKVGGSCEDQRHNWQSSLEQQYLDSREQNTEWSEVVVLAHGLRDRDFIVHRTCCILLMKADQVEIGNEFRDRYRRLGVVLFKSHGDHLFPHIDSWPIRSYYVI